MATTTTNYGLTKPSYGDNADIAVINSNMDKIDSKMKEIEDAGGSGASTWAEVAEKPFETVGSGLSVDESGALNATGGGSGGGISYSTEETVIGTWIDGKPIYRKVISCLSPSAKNTITSIYDISDLNVCDLINIYGQFQKAYMPINCIQDVSMTRISTWLENGNIMCVIGNSGHVNLGMDIILEYTKTTD